MCNDSEFNSSERDVEDQVVVKDAPGVVKRITKLVRRDDEGGGELRQERVNERRG